MAKKSGLGKGLGAIFGNDADKIEKAPTVQTLTKEKLNETIIMPKEATGTAEKSVGNDPEETLISAEKSGETSVMIRVALIEPNRNQPRKDFNEDRLSELADSMKRYGVLQPLLVKQNGRMYEIIAGERRWRAAKLAGLREVPAVVRSFQPQESAEIAIIENIQREDLGPVEEARAYQSLIDEYGLTQEEVAGKVSKNRSTITNSLRLLQLTENVLNMLSEGKISAGHARCLIPVSDQDLQEQLAAEIVEKKLSVRETEKLVKALTSGKKKKKEEEPREQELNMYLIDIARKLTASLNTKVLIKQGSKGRGKIEIDYYSNEDLEKIIGRLR